MGRGDQYKTIWVTKGREVAREWGHELLLGTLSTCALKILFLNKGNKTSLKYYNNKNEVLFVRSGMVRVEYDSEKYHWQDYGPRSLKTTTLVAGDVLCVQSQCPYRITAIEDSEIIEIGDTALDKAIRIDESEEI